MEKLKVNLIALDLDDTLLDDERKISDKNVEVLRRCAQRGIYVVLCSGRAEDAIRPFVSRLNIAALNAGKFVISTNGCSIFDMHERRQIYKRTVSSDILHYVHNEAKKMGFETEVYTADTIYYSRETEWTLKDVTMCSLKGECPADYDKFIDNEFLKMLVPGEPEKLQVLQEKLKKDLGDKAVIFTSKPYFLEIMPPNCGKGEAVQWLANYIGIAPETTMAFGDSMNDESMITKCGYGVAMCNGNKDIKKIAAYVTEKSNNESGIADFIEKYVL